MKRSFSVRRDLDGFWTIEMLSGGPAVGMLDFYGAEPKAFSISDGWSMGGRKVIIRRTSSYVVLGFSAWSCGWSWDLGELMMCKSLQNLNSMILQLIDLIELD